MPTQDPQERWAYGGGTELPVQDYWNRIELGNRAYNPHAERLPIRQSFGGIDIHRQLGATQAMFYSDDNVRALQGRVQELGYGIPNKTDLKVYMDYACRFFNGDNGLRPGYGNATCEDAKYQVVNMNRRVIDMILPWLKSSRVGYRKYILDRQYHRFPDRPIDASICKNGAKDTIINPYYYGMY
jgi:hypothetical protein